MKIIISAQYPRKMLVLTPETHAEEFQLRAIIEACDKAKIPTLRTSDIDGRYDGTGIDLKSI